MKLNNRIVKTGWVDWRSLKILQPESLKIFTDESLEKLKQSLIQKDFICSFNVWEDDSGTIWVLDGTHRIKALDILTEEGHEVPDKLVANFIQCKNKREAANLVLIYSSQYASITQDGLDTFMANEKLTANLDIIDIPDVKLSGEMNIPYIQGIVEEKDSSDDGTSEYIDSISRKKSCCPKCGGEDIYIAPNGGQREIPNIIGGS